MIKTIKTNQENVKLTIFSSTEDSWFGPKYLEHFLYDFFTHFFKFNWC